MLSQLIAGNAEAGQSPSPETITANQHWRDYLHLNVAASEVLRSMRDSIHTFASYAPRLFVSKCIDGRVHGSDAKGYPPTTVTFSRTDGNRVELTPENLYFWNRLNEVVLSARRHTPDCPALFLALGHYACLGHGCAAHGEDNHAALSCVADQAERLRARYRPRDLYVLHGMTNTDDSAERIIFGPGRELDTAAIIATLDTPRNPLRTPTDVFNPAFLDRLFDDLPTDRAMNHHLPRELLSDARRLDLRTRIALEGYLLREVTLVVRNGDRNNVVFAPRVFQEVCQLVDAVEHLPEPLKAPLIYQTLWNIVSTLRERELLPTLSPEDRRRRLEHAEVKVGYGDGFEIEGRNRLVLAKPGRGDDQKALQVARKVLLNNRLSDAQPHPPLVHVNLEYSGEFNGWDNFDHDVLAPLKTRIDNVIQVFGDDCRILVTYSRRAEKCFYPIAVTDDVDPRITYPVDITRGLTDENFDREHLAIREQAYRQLVQLEASPS